MSNQANLCVRCNQPLPPGESFCLSCGFHNELMSQDKQFKVGQQLANRRSAWGRFVQFLRMLGFPVRD